MIEEKSDTVQFGFTNVGEGAKGAHHLFWGHGWGQSSASFAPMAAALAAFYPSTLVDFPGSNGTPPPPLDAGTAEIADALAKEIRALNKGRLIWIGHSFGCRIGIQLAARHPDLLSGMILIAAAGLQRKRTLAQQVKFRGRILAYKAARSLLPEGPAREKLRGYFGSADYKSAGPLRSLLVRVVGEDLTDVAAKISCPTWLIYGEQDKDTPPEIGARLHKLIDGSELILLDRYDHHTILNDGKHQVTRSIRQFVEGLK